MMHVDIKEIFTQSRAALTRHGAEDWIAEEVASAIAAAESHGNKICGLYYLESYCQQLVSGRVSGSAVPEVSRPRPGVVAVDAQYGFAQAAFSRGLEPAVQAVRENGIATLAIAHAHTCTSLGYFTEQIARRGFMAIGATNATPAVAPPGGRLKAIGTNPFAFSVPDGAGGIAMQFDFSTSAVARGKITMAQAAGKPIPEGWAVDADGQPTTDPDAALAGSLASMGGYKGWGLGLMVELLAAGLTGSLNSVDIAPLKAPEGGPHDIGQTYILIDPSFSPDFADRFRRLAEVVSADENGRLPGADRQPMQTVEVDDAVWRQVQDLSGDPL